MTTLDDRPDPVIIRWEDPPPRLRASGRKDWRPVAAELKMNPGRWALVFEVKAADAEQRVAHGIGGGIATATLTAFRPAGAFEAVTRLVGDRTLVYARFMDRSSSGEQPSPPSPPA